MTLILMRHAKSDWSSDLKDIDRPLNRRGREASARLGQWLSKLGLWPDLALISSATRTRKTWARLAAPDTTKMLVLQDLYLATPGQILKTVQDVSDAQRLLVLGHNPGIGELAAWLADTPPAHPDFTRYPTGATTVFNLPATPWEHIQPGSGQVE
ncbi:MAG: histidine phosphatase family protein, partial [Pseudomonadota bacterium]